MSEILFLVGASNAGKDYIADNYYKNFTHLKLTSAFKEQYEKDHWLKPGSCNNKNLRESVHDTGPMAGLTISEGMVLSYQQSISGIGYGAKFKGITITSTLTNLVELSRNNKPVVITDLRKTTELKVLIPFAEIIHYEVRMILVKSNAETPKDSDRSLETNMDLFEYLTGQKVELKINNRLLTK